MISTNKKRKNRQTEEKLTNCFLIKLSGKVAVLAPLLLMTLLCVHYESAEGVLVQIPTDTTVIVNHSTVFNCSKFNNKSIEPIWYHHPLVGARQDVYDQKIRDKYKDRFSIDKNLTSGTFNLLVQRPETTDAGIYECVEDFFKDKGSSAELTVLESNLVCKSDKDLNEVVGPTECAKFIVPNQLQFSCSVTYSGNFPPQMEWIKVGSELQSNETKCVARNNRVMCNTTKEADLNKDGSVYICQVITAEQYNCSLKSYKYTFSDTFVGAITTTEEAFCSANTSKDLSCSYKWYKDNKMEHSSQTLKPSTPGKYICEAECKIRNETCAFTAMVINVSEPGTGERKLMGLLVLLVIPLVIFTGLVYHLWKKNHEAQELQNTKDQTELLPAQPAKQAQPAPSQYAKQDETDSNDAIREAFDKATLIRKGLSGDIQGPVHYKDIQCVCMYERIMCTKDEEKTVNYNGRKWMALNHKNLIKVFDVVLQPSAVYIVMEYAIGESVRDALDKLTEDLPIEVVMDWAMQICQGLIHLHEKCIVHKYIKSAQIFIVESSDMEKTLKIACSNLFGNNAIYDGISVTRKIAISPPEKECTEKYDVWSFGIVIWEILTRTEPYKGMIRQEIDNDISNGATKLNIPDSCPKELQEVLKGCRNVEPSERPSFNDILLLLKK